GPFNGTIFGCGDPNRPGYLYWANSNQPDAWSPINNIETTAASDPLQNGFMYGGQSYVFSKENLFTIFPSQIGLSNQYQPVPSACSRGLFAPWALAAGQNVPGIFFLAKDGIYVTSGGPETSLSEDS